MTDLIEKARKVMYGINPKYKHKWATSIETAMLDGFEALDKQHQAALDVVKAGRILRDSSVLGDNTIAWCTFEDALFAYDALMRKETEHAI